MRIENHNVTLLTAVLLAIAAIHGRSVGYLDAMRYTQWFNILGNPAVTVPVTRSAESLPVGVQLVGRPFDDCLVMTVAAVIERECGGYTPPPGFGGA